MELDLQHVSAGYGSITVLHDLSLMIPARGILGILGRNGMGKSTLVRCISGLNPATYGRIVAGGRDITSLPVHDRARLGITAVLQGRGTFANMTVRENLEMGRVGSGVGLPSRLDEVLGYFPHLGGRLDQRAGTLSGGEQQMLAIGRAFMAHPKVILLDEPSDGISPLLVQQIAEILVRINREQGITVLIVEQNVPMVFSMTRECAIMEKGKIVLRGHREDLERGGAMDEYLVV
ncbi:MAG TPA: ABC transporter ATP-binding protein [Azospirillum sp.]|nr:ABC transporter ATP-binding protein [Azospirillum sp.]